MTERILNEKSIMMSNNGTTGKMNLPTNSSVDTEALSLLVQELSELGFDAIRFSSYRTAAKLRYIQKKSNYILIDLWNVIEGFREHGLNGLDPYSIITVPKLESIVTSLFHNLNKRLPLSQQVNVLNCARYLLSWLLIAYDSEGSGRVRVFSAKVGLVTLCNGKLLDKLRYVFSLISDTSGLLVLTRFKDYLIELLSLTRMVLESSTFGYTDGLATTIFDGTSKITLNGFLDAILNEPSPPILMWLPLLHSLAIVEDVNHRVQCSVCKIGSIQGYRYKCQKCSNFNMCQDCFWQGKIADNHRSDHEVKEYATLKSGSKGLRNSFRKSFRCVPEKPKKIVPRFPDEPERCLNLTHIVPPSPMPVHNGFGGYDALDAYSDQKMFALDFGAHGPSRMTNSYTESVSESDEEHRLIARYTARLASDNKYPPAPNYHSLQRTRTLSQTSMSLFGSTQSQRELIAQLEARNREIMNEITRLRAQQEQNYLNGEAVDPIVMDELQALREHKMDLEDKLSGLQDSRKNLMFKLEGLMRLLKAQQLSPNDTPESSPRSGKTPPMTIYSQPGSLHRSAPVTPHHSETYTSGDLRSSFSNSTEVYGESKYHNESNDVMSRSLRNDLLMAADSVTNAMSSLVKELNSDENGTENSVVMKPLDFELSGGYAQIGHWRKEMGARLEEQEKYKYARKFYNGSSHNGVEVGYSYAAVNGTNESYQNKNVKAEEYDKRGDSNGRRRKSLGNDEPIYSKPNKDHYSSIAKQEVDEYNGTDWEDGLKRRLV